MKRFLNLWVALLAAMILVFSAVPAFAATGDLIWKFKTGGAIYSSPVLLGDSLVCFGSADSCFYAVRIDGSQKWKIKTEGPILSSAAVTKNGDVCFSCYDPDISYSYVVDSSGNVLRTSVSNQVGYNFFNEDGKFLSFYDIGDEEFFRLANVYAGGANFIWDCPLPSGFAGRFTSCGPSFGFHGQFYLSGYFSSTVYGNRCGAIVALSKDGEFLWMFKTSELLVAKEETFAPPSIDGDGNLYFGTNLNKVYSIDSNGSLRWAASIGNSSKGIRSAIMLGDSVVYARSSSGSIAILSMACGEILKTVPVPADSIGNSNQDVLLGDDGKAYGSSEKKFWGVSLQTGLKDLNYTAGNMITSSPAISGSGIIFFGCMDSCLYAIDSGSGKGLLSNAQWGMHRKDVRHTAKAEGDTSVDAVDEEIPLAFELKGVFPNPFNPSTTIQFVLDRPEKVSLRVYNATGQVVAELVSNRRLEKGNHQVVWNGAQFSSGLYFCVLQSGTQKQAQKMLLLK